MRAASLSLPTSAQDSGAGPLTRAGRPRPACRAFEQIRMAGQGPAADAGVRPTKPSGIGRFSLPARLFIALLFPFTLSAQLTLVTFDGTTETPVGSVYDYGKVATGGAKDVRFRARNTGNSAVV